MSGFLLWWSHDRAPFPPATYERVERSLARWAPDGVRRQAVPGAVAFHGHFDSAGGAEAGLPFVSEEWLLTGSVRLDDRASLRAKLRDAGEVVPEPASDARLLLSALRAWGDEAATHLRGDFAFAALDRRRHQLLAARSAFGVRPLFVTSGQEGIIVASDTASVAGALGVTLPHDEEALVEFLREGLLLGATATYRRGVERLPAATQYSWDSTGARRARPCWRFPRPDVRPRVQHAEAVEGFREALGSAVSDRLRGPQAGLFLSGGLDSTALAATMRRVRPEVEVAALSVGSDPVLEHDEPLWAGRAAAAIGMPLHVMRDATDTALEHVADGTVFTDEPIDEPELLSLRAQVEWVSARARTTVYGEDGDALLAAPPLHTVLRSLGVKETIRAWITYARAQGERPWVGLRELGPIRRWRAARAARSPSWLRVPDRTQRTERTEAAEHPTHPNAVRAFERPTWEAFVGGLAPDVIGRAHDFTFPLLDERVIAHVFSLPPIPWCQRKHLLRASFSAELPASLLARAKEPLRGYDEALVARWRARGGAEVPLPLPMDLWVDLDRWRAALRTGSATEVREAWRVFELARWLAQEPRA